MELRPISLRDARFFIAAHHRHHDPPQGAKIAVAAWHLGSMVGVAMLGRPVSRMLDNGDTAEVIRVATDGTRNACSFLYGAAKRAAQALGYRKVLTYTLESESRKAIGSGIHQRGYEQHGRQGTIEI